MAVEQHSKTHPKFTYFSNYTLPFCSYYECSLILAPLVTHCDLIKAEQMRYL